MTVSELCCQSCFSSCSVVKKIHLPMQEMWVQSLDWEDPLEKEMATRSSILAWEIPWTQEPGGLQSTGLQKVRHRRDSRAERGSLLPLEMNACLPGCVWNATPRSRSPL